MKTRTGQLYWLIGLTAATMIPQYALQSWLATGHNPAEIANWFWWFDAVSWSIRAIIEAAALVYLFSTQAKSKIHTAILTGFEVALIALIVVTLGPVLYSVGKESIITETLTDGWHIAWSFAVAAYAPLMLGAVGFAYKVQMAQAEPEAKSQTKPAAKLAPETERKSSQPAKVAEVAPQTGDLQGMSAQERRPIVAQLLTEGAKPAELAEMFGVSPSAISRDKQALKALNGAVRK